MSRWRRHLETRFKTERPRQEKLGCKGWNGASQARPKSPYRTDFEVLALSLIQHIDSHDDNADNDDNHNDDDDSLGRFLSLCQSSSPQGP